MNQTVRIDSREVVPGALFVALAGENTDGHRFVEAAFEKGAAAALVEQRKIAEFRLDEAAARYGAQLLPCENTLTGLQKLAADYLDGFPHLLRIGITGSSGKTTTKEIALSIFKQRKKVIANKGNLNSETGLPLSVFEVRAEHEVGIFEAGMNRHGEIAELARVLRPHIALITNVGSAHIGRIGSRESIALEKKALFSAFTGREKAIIDADGDFAALLSQGINGTVVWWYSGEEKTTARSLGLRGWEIDIDGTAARFPLPGRHNLKNALAAIALAQAAGIDGEAVRAGLTSVTPLFGRAEIIEEGGVTVVRDCYNANPESAAAAIALCDELEWHGKRIYVIGSMLELGDESEAAHRELGGVLLKSKADNIFLFGEETAAALPLLNGKQVFYTNDMDALKTALFTAALSTAADTNSLILLKGSRGCALERAWDLP